LMVKSFLYCFSFVVILLLFLKFFNCWSSNLSWMHVAIVLLSSCNL
jgi:hypothetical protein